MAALLKSFGRGIMYIFVLPVLLIVLAFYAVIGVVVFVFISIKGIILYFTGRNIFGDLPEDVLAKKILANEPIITDESQLQEKKEEVHDVSYHTYFAPLDNSLIAPVTPNEKKEEQPNNNNNEGEGNK